MAREYLSKFSDDIQRIATFELEKELAGTNVHYYIFAEKYIKQILSKHYKGAKPSNIKKVAKKSCRNPQFIINRGSWGGKLFPLAPAQIPAKLKSEISGGGTICKLIATKSFNLEGFQTAVNTWKIERITNEMRKLERKNQNESLLQKQGRALREDLTRIHGTGGYHSTARVGAATQGEKSSSLGSAPTDMTDTDEMDTFIMPFFRQELSDILKVTAGVDFESSTKEGSVDDEVAIAVRMAEEGQQATARSFDKGGIALNDALSKAEDALIAELESQFGTGAKEIKASPSTRKRIRRMAVETVVKKVKTKSNLKARVTAKITEPKVKKGKRKVAAKSKPSKKQKGVSKGKVTVRGKGKTTKRAQRQPANNPIGLVALLNRSLPAQVQKNMAPLRGSFPRRLTYRTGRFASSAEVTNVAPYPNMVEIQYTYDKDPYQVFEQGSGSTLATGPGRDPREIIGQSIREIAQQMMGTRFGIVRTKRV